MLSNMLLVVFLFVPSLTHVAAQFNPGDSCTPGPNLPDNAFDICQEDFSQQGMVCSFCGSGKVVKGTCGKIGDQPACVLPLRTTPTVTQPPGFNPGDSCTPGPTLPDNAFDICQADFSQMGMDCSFCSSGTVAKGTCGKIADQPACVLPVTITPVPTQPPGFNPGDTCTPGPTLPDNAFDICQLEFSQLNSVCSFCASGKVARGICGKIGDQSACLLVDGIPGDTSASSAPAPISISPPATNTASVAPSAIQVAGGAVISSTDSSFTSNGATSSTPWGPIIVALLSCNILVLLACVGLYAFNLYKGKKGIQKNYKSVSPNEAASDMFVPAHTYKYHDQYAD